MQQPSKSMHATTKQENNKARKQRSKKTTKQETTKQENNKARNNKARKQQSGSRFSVFVRRDPRHRTRAGAARGFLQVHPSRGTAAGRVGDARSKCGAFYCPSSHTCKHVMPLSCSSSAYSRRWEARVVWKMHMRLSLPPTSSSLPQPQSVQRASRWALASSSFSGSRRNGFLFHIVLVASRGLSYACLTLCSRC